MSSVLKMKDINLMVQGILLWMVSNQERNLSNYREKNSMGERYHLVLKKLKNFYVILFRLTNFTPVFKIKKAQKPISLKAKLKKKILILQFELIMHKSRLRKSLMPMIFKDKWKYNWKNKKWKRKRLRLSKK